MIVAIGFLAAAANIVSVSSRQRIVPDAIPVIRLGWSHEAMDSGRRSGWR